MIEAKDLRIGNILLDENNKLIEVETIHSDGVNYMDGHIYGTKYEYLTPIKLPPEILEQIAVKYDWKHCDYEHYIIKCSVDVILRVVSENEIVLFTNDLCDKSRKNYICKVGSLHRLQNSYQIITNKELPIDINTLKV